MYLEGYWQSPKYFIEFEKQIRDSFIYNVDFDDNVKELKNKIFSNESICINVRRGDFVNNDFHGTMGINYYLNSLNYLKSITNSNFKIFVFLL